MPSLMNWLFISLTSLQLDIENNFVMFLTLLLSEMKCQKNADKLFNPCVSVEGIELLNQWTAFGFKLT